MSAIYILWLREVKKYSRSRVQIVASLGQPLQVGSGRTPISIKAQAVTPDRIQHDEENVRGTSRRQGTTRFAPLLQPVSTKYRTRQQQDRSQKNGKSPAQERQSPFGRLRLEPGNQV